MALSQSGQMAEKHATNMLFSRSIHNRRIVSSMLTAPVRGNVVRRVLYLPLEPNGVVS